MWSFAIILSVILFTTSALDDPPDVKKGCECGIFANEMDTEPIKSYKVLEAECNPGGGKLCQTMCVNLATIYKSRAPSILCSYMKSDAMEPFLPSLFWRNCQEKWTHSGFMEPAFISCKDGKPQNVK